MGHQVVSCPNCRAWVMEGRNDWKCDCGHVMSSATGYCWTNPDGLTLKERHKKESKGKKKKSKGKKKDKKYLKFLD